MRVEPIQTEVLVVGAGLTGATAGLLLARHGIATMMVSRGKWVADSPRAHIINQRTMEVMRAVGLGGKCYASAAPGTAMANHVMMTAVNGVEFGRLWTWGQDPARAGEYAYSPGKGCDLPQDRFEPILVDEAMARGVVTRFSTKFIELKQDADGVTTTLEDEVTGTRFQVRSKYVIGADGGQSPVAKAIDLPFTGQAVAPALNVWFRGDLSRYFEDRPGSIFWILQPGREGRIGNAVLRMVRPWNEWVIGFVHLGETVLQLSGEEVVQQVRDIIQDDSVEIEVIGVYPWRINNVTADAYGEGRVLCAGDAVHRHPPMNGLGGNTCIQDSFNLAWKLVAVLRWGAGPELLDSYEAERKPVGKHVVARAMAGWHQNPDVVRSLGIDPNAAPTERMAQFERLFEDSDEGEARRGAFEQAKRSKIWSYHAHGTEMNQIYESTAVLEEGLPPVTFARDPELYYQPMSRPGARVLHCWLQQHGQTISTLDLCGPEQFTLLTRSRGSAWVEAAAQAAEELGVPVKAYRLGLGGDVADLYGDWGDTAGIGEQGCVLVRPDQFVAWMSEGAAQDPFAALTDALKRCLSK